MESEAHFKMIADLEQQRKYWMDSISRANGELQRVELELRALRSPNLFNPAGAVSSIEPTATGMLRGLSERILELLESAQACMTASMIADALYSFNMNITVEKLTRRVSVTASSMYKDHGDKPLLMDSKEKNDRREIYWAKPEWVVDGELLEKYSTKKKGDNG